MDHFSERFKGTRTPSSQIDRGPAENPAGDLGENKDRFDETEFEKYICQPFTMGELDASLDSLPSNKSAGPDHIANELIRNSSFKARMYLQIFLNKILEEGKVPNPLNKGKCVLVFKVSYEVQDYNILIFLRAAIP